MDRASSRGRIHRACVPPLILALQVVGVAKGCLSSLRVPRPRLMSTRSDAQDVSCFGGQAMPRCHGRSALAKVPARRPLVPPAFVRAGFSVH